MTYSTATLPSLRWLLAVPISAAPTGRIVPLGEALDQLAITATIDLGPAIGADGPRPTGVPFAKLRSFTRAAVIAGFASTSNLEAGRRYGIKTVGTAAHSFTLLHDTERDAFEAQLASMGAGTALLVDTYDVMAAIRTGVELTHGRLGAVRLDSGDLGLLAGQVRQLLDALGAEQTKIVVTSDLDEFAIAALPDRPRSAAVARMSVRHQQFGRHVGHRGQLVGGRGEGLQRGEVVHVTDVPAQPGVSAGADREGVLQVAAGGQRRPDRHRHRDRQGCVAARPAHRKLIMVDHPEDGVVAGHLDRSVVLEPAVGEGLEAHPGVLIIGDDRLAGQIAAGHHQDAGPRRVTGQAEQEPVHRRVGQHHAELAGGRRDGAGDRGAGAARREDDGPLPRREQSPGRVVELDQLQGRLGGGRHQSEGLVLAVLAGAQFADDRLVVRAAGEVITAEALDGEDPALGEGQGGGLE